MYFEQKGNSPVRSCLIASRGLHMIWDSAHNLGFRDLNHCCGVMAKMPLFQSVHVAEDWDNGSALSTPGLVAI
jgi:hypothetical protein